MRFTELIPSLNATAKLLRSFKRITKPALCAGEVKVRVEKGEAVFIRKETKE